MKFTTASVTALKRPAGKADHVEWSDEMPGLGVRMRGDAKTWLVQYRIGLQQRRESLGDVRKVKLEDARKAAQQRFAKVKLGVDPAAEKVKARTAAAAAALTLGAVADRYLAVKEEVLRPSTFTAAKRYFTMHWQPLRARPLDSIKRADVAALLHDLIKAHGKVAAARARTSLSALYSWALREGLCDANPVVATNAPDAHVRSRARVLTLDELAAAWRACQDDDFGYIVKLLILTACRRMEVGGLRRDEVDFDAGTLIIPGERVKNGRTLMVPLAPAAIAILRSVPRREGRSFVFGQRGMAFSGWTKSTADLRRRIAAVTGRELADFRLHDLRRSAATHMGGLGVQPHVIEQILNHQSGYKRGPAGIYNRASYEREKRAALALWAEALMAAIEGRKPQVVPLMRGA
jgi:integrase